MNQRVAFAFLLVVTGILALSLDAKTARAADPPAAKPLTADDLNTALAKQLAPIIKALSDLKPKAADPPAAKPLTVDDLKKALADQLAPITTMAPIMTKLNALQTQADTISTAVKKLQDTADQQKTMVDALQKAVTDFDNALDKKAAAKASAAASATATPPSTAPTSWAYYFLPQTYFVAAPMRGSAWGQCGPVYGSTWACSAPVYVLAFPAVAPTKASDGPPAATKPDQKQPGNTADVKASPLTVGSVPLETPGPRVIHDGPPAAPPAAFPPAEPPPP